MTIKTIDFILVKIKILLTISFVLIFNILIYSQNEIVTVRINNNKKFQTIQNFGASGCWYAEPIGKWWPLEKKNKLVEQLFSLDTFADGSPKGLGLSAWRFNIGAGTAEQGDSSGIIDPNHRTECFLDKNGNYNWDKQIGYQWFLKKAIEYKVPDLIAFVNSPPVFYNKNGLGYMLTKGNTTNLESKHYQNFSSFLCNVLQHFDSIGIHFNYVSPINEPQWEWNYDFGKSKQEGSPYQNEEIFQLIKTFDKSLSERKLKTKILIPEAAMLNHLTDSNVLASNQIEQFWDPKSQLYLGNCQNIASIAAGHGYFTDVGDSATKMFRQKITAKTSKYKLDYWQSEYCLLGDGYKEGQQSRSSFDCGMFLAKIIHYDLTVGNATAWQYWNAFEPGDWQNNTRYYLFALKSNANCSNGEFYNTGNYYALGHFSRFVRPNMQRIEVKIDNNENNLFISAYENPQTKQLVIVIVNYSNKFMTLNLQSEKQLFKMYETTEVKQLKYKGKISSDKIDIAGRSINTLVAEIK